MPDWTLKQFQCEWALANALNAVHVFAGVSTIASRGQALREIIVRSNRQFDLISKRRHVTFAEYFERTYRESLETGVQQHGFELG